MNNSTNKAWRQYEAGKDYKRRIGLYETVRRNERFYRGDQWYGISADSLPKPIFNIVRRVADYLTCTVAPGKISISYSGSQMPYVKNTDIAARLKRATDALSENAAYRWEKDKMDSKLHRLVSDAAISGDGVIYCYWNGSLDGEGDFSGDISTDVIDNTDLFVADVNTPDIQSQEYVILSGRASVASLRREAKKFGVDKKDILKIAPDAEGISDKMSDLSSIELDGDDEAKATYIIKFWREDGRVCFEKSTKECVIRRAKTPCKLYPVAYFNWYPTKNSFHGTSPISGIIPNQRYINRSYAMVMKHMSDTAFSKVIYDKSKIPEWSNEVGEAIAAISGTNVSDAVSVVGVGKLQDKYLDFLSNVISVTKELGGATETALGNITPTNTSAILAIQEASKIPLKLVRSSLYQCIEDLANIWADMMCAYFTSERLLPGISQTGESKSEYVDFSLFEKDSVISRIDVIDTSTYSSSITLSILDKLLEGGHISAAQYLKRIPSEYIENYTELIEEEKDNGREAYK